MEMKVEFENHNLIPREKNSKKNSEQTQSFMIKALMEAGIIKNSQYASLVLLVVAIVIFIVAGFIMYYSLFGSTGADTVYREDIPPEILDQLPRETLRTIPSRD